MFFDADSLAYLDHRIEAWSDEIPRPSSHDPAADDQAAQGVVMFEVGLTLAACLGAAVIYGLLASATGTV